MDPAGRSAHPVGAQAVEIDRRLRLGAGIALWLVKAPPAVGGQPSHGLGAREHEQLLVGLPAVGLNPRELQRV